MKKKLLFILFLTPVLFMGVWLGSGGTLWKLINGNTLKPAMSTWDLDIGTVSMDTLYLGAKRLYESGAYLYSPDRIKSAVELASNGYVSSGTYITARGYLSLDYDNNDSATYISFHNRDTLWADTLHNLRWGGNSFLGDSGKTTTIGKGGKIEMSSADLVDTLQIGAGNPNSTMLAKNGYLYLGGQNVYSMQFFNTRINFNLPLTPSGNNNVDIGASGYKVRNFYIAGSIVDSTGLISGSGTFPATYTCDTFLLSGVVSTDVIQAGWKGATIPNKPLTSVAGTDTIFIYCDVSDTTKARAEGFTYIRFNHK